MTCTFTCKMCGETFAQSRTDQEAWADYRRDYPDADPEDEPAVVCEDCYIVLQGWRAKQVTNH